MFTFSVWSEARFVVTVPVGKPIDHDHLRVKVKPLQRGSMKNERLARPVPVGSVGSACVKSKGNHDDVCRGFQIGFQLEALVCHAARFTQPTGFAARFVEASRPWLV